MKEKRYFKILDCSLRDGGYYTNWDFDFKFVEEYLKIMNDLPIDYVEIGYRSKPQAGYKGAYFYCPEFILKHAFKHSKKKLAIIINEKELEPGDLEELLGPCEGIISLVRIAVHPDKISSALTLAEGIKEMGYEVSLNIMYLSNWEDSLLDKIKSGVELVDFLYLVDSYGASYPEEVEIWLTKIASVTKVPLGFHAHNNLELSLANTLTAIDNGAAIVDSTIMGMGRGAGNLKTELLLTSLQSRGRLEDFNYNALSRAVDLFSVLWDKYRWGSNLAYMVSGANSLPQQEVMSQLNKRFYSLNSIVRGIRNKVPGLSDQSKLREFSGMAQVKNAIIVGGGASGTLHARAIRTFLRFNPDTCLIHSSSRNAAAYKEVKELQYHCLEGNEGYRLEKVYSNLKGSSKVAILPPFPRTMGTYIPEALEQSVFQLQEISFSQENSSSVTALAIEAALKLRAEKIYFVGYDGYEGSVTEAQMELFRENEELFKALKAEGVGGIALTSTKYRELRQESVYNYL